MISFIFNIFDNSNFGVAHSNDLAAWGKNISATKYNTCIRNPSSKYWNTYAMLLEEDHDPENDVFNTGIMAASSKVIQEFDYFKDSEILGEGYEYLLQQYRLLFRPRYMCYNLFFP